MIKTSQILSNYIAILSRQFLTGGLQLFIFVIISHNLGANNTGQLVTLLLLPEIVIQVISLGLGPAFVYLVASKKYSAARGWSASRDVTYLLSVIGVIIILAVFVIFRNTYLYDYSYEAMALTMALIPIFYINNLMSHILLSKSSLKAYNIVITVQPLCHATILIFLYITKIMSIESIILSHLLSHALMGVVSATQVNGFLRGRWRTIFHIPRGKVSRYITDALVFGVPAQLSNVITFLNYRLDMILVGILVGPEGVGIYAVVIKIAETLWALTQGISTVIFPILSGKNVEKAERASTTAFITRQVLIITAVMGIGVAICGDQFITKLFGPEYINGKIPLLLILPGVILFSGSKVLAASTAAIGRTKYNLVLSIRVLLINVLAMAVLIPMYGVSGAATASTIAYIADFTMRTVSSKEILGIRWVDLLLVRFEDYKAMLRKQKE